MSQNTKPVQFIRVFKQFMTASLPLLPLEGLPFSLLIGQTAEELLHLPLPLRIPDAQTQQHHERLAWLECSHMTRTSRSPAHDVIEFLPSQEPSVLPDLPQRSLKLALVLVLESLSLLLFFGVPSLFTVIQTGRERRGMISLALESQTWRICQREMSSYFMFDSHLHNFRCEEFQWDGFLLLEHQRCMLGRLFRNGI